VRFDEVRTVRSGFVDQHNETSLAASSFLKLLETLRGDDEHASARDVRSK
jgi:hypothetical protein